MKPALTLTPGAVKRLSIALWLLMLLVCAAIIARSQFTADLSAFLPKTPTAEQQLLMDQLRDGLASRLILVGIEGGDTEVRSTLSKAMAHALRANPAFVTVNNGEPLNTERDRAYLFNHRYLLSQAVTPQRFSTPGLQEAISDTLDQLASPAGLLIKSLLPHDPTGEMMQLVEQMDNGNRPQLMDGSWASADGRTTLLLLQTRALGSDTDAQKQAMQAIQGAFDAASAALAAGLAKPELRMTGPGVFSVVARDTIKLQVRVIFIISSVLIAGLLLLVYRSPVALLLGFLPVATGVLAGIAAVSLGFGVVHGITLGFGTALIGEAVDYSIYLFMQSDHGGTAANSEQQRRRWIALVWPTVRLGVLTSVFGFASLLLSGFPGLAQLGLYSIVGLIAAAAMTRYVLPYLLPRGFHIRDVSAVGLRLAGLAAQASRLRWLAVALLAAACVVVFLHKDHLWNNELAALSPVSAADQALDKRLRAAMGAPDVRYMVVIAGDSQQAMLQASEQAAVVMQGLVERGELSAFESASRYLPSLATQRARQASLPPAATLQASLDAAVSSMPVKAASFAPFVADVEAARRQALLQRSDLEHTSMAMALDAMLLQQGQRWSALLPLTAPAGGEIHAEVVKQALHDAHIARATFVDLKTESNHLYAGYLHEAIALSLAGLVAIIVLLLVVLKSFTRMLAVVLPLAAAVLTVTAGLALFGQQLIILHLIGLLLIVAIGSNYALFFNQPQGSSSAPDQVSPRTYASLLFANVATVLGFGLLAFSSVPVLQAMGLTVAPGVILALVFSAVFMPSPAATGGPA